MSRRHAAKKRVILPDVKYNSTLLARFINNVMKKGKKSLAERIVYESLSRIEKKHKVNAYDIFNDAVNNVKPYLEVTSIRIGGANYQVPSPVDEKRGYALATRWIIEIANKRSEKSMVNKLSEELFEAANNKGSAIKKKEDTHKMAEANKAFSHFSTKRTQRR